MKGESLLAPVEQRASWRHGARVVREAIGDSFEINEMESGGSLWAYSCFVWRMKDIV